MKKMNINLSDLSGRELSNREKLSLRGGDEGGATKCCQCGCCYMNDPIPGASIEENRSANYVDGLTSPCMREWGTKCTYQAWDPVAQEFVEYHMDYCSGGGPE